MVCTNNVCSTWYVVYVSDPRKSRTPHKDYCCCPCGSSHNALVPRRREGYVSQGQAHLCLHFIAIASLTHPFLHETPLQKSRRVGVNNSTK